MTVTDEEAIEAYEKMLLEIYQRYVWVPDEDAGDGDGDGNGDGGYFEDTQTGDTLTTEEVQTIIDNLTPTTPTTTDLVNINENQVPLASPPVATTTILDGEVPLVALPSTGGAAKKAAPVAGIMAVLGGLLISLKSLKKEDEE
jgi:LPXTG-motif cell wall-anchored protein